MGLAAAGYSNTRARRAVLGALAQVESQVSAAELHALARADHPSLGLVTVYRTLELLESLGFVRRLHLEEGCHTYVLSSAGIQQAGDAARPAGPKHRPHSHHIVCQHCRRATEFAGCNIDAVARVVEAQTGYRVHEHWLEMFGLCPECQAQSAAPIRPLTGCNAAFSKDRWP